MGLVEWFLGIHFSWRFTSSRVDVHLNQTGFAANLVKQFCRDSWDATPTATPYCSGVPINSIAPSTDAMILQLNFVGRRLIKVSSEASVGWRRLHDLTWRRSTPFSHPITANPHRDTCVQLFLSFIISTRLMILASTSLRLLRIRFTRSFTFQTLWMLKPIRMLIHPLPLTYLLSRPTAMHVGAPKLVRPFGMALYFLYSRFEA